MEQQEQPKNQENNDEQQEPKEEQISAGDQEEVEISSIEQEVQQKLKEREEKAQSDENTAGLDIIESKEEVEEQEEQEQQEQEQKEEVKTDEAAEVQPEELEEKKNKNMRWYVVHTLSGQEYKVKEILKNNIATQHMEDLVGEVLIPAENVSEVKAGKKIITTRKFFPGYILVQMEFTEETWHLVKNTPGVIGFVGSGNPVPLSEGEIQDILGQIESKKEKVKPKVIFEKGEVIKVTDGPFINFNGIVDETYPDKGKLKVMISMFGRTTPVELEYWQVERE